MALSPYDSAGSAVAGRPRRAPDDPAGAPGVGRAAAGVSRMRSDRRRRLAREHSFRDPHDRRRRPRPVERHRHAHEPSAAATTTHHGRGHRAQLAVNRVGEQDLARLAPLPPRRAGVGDPEQHDHHEERADRRHPTQHCVHHRRSVHCRVPLSVRSRIETPPARGRETRSGRTSTRRSGAGRGGSSSRA